MPRFLLAVCVYVGASLAALAQSEVPNDSSLGLKPPTGAVVLFGGENLEGWTQQDGKTPATWTVKDGAFTVKPKSGGIRTKETFGDFQLHVEFNIPLMPDAKGQARGNSGVYLTGNYELQVLDSYGLKLKHDDCGTFTSRSFLE